MELLWVLWVCTAEQYRPFWFWLQSKWKRKDMEFLRIYKLWKNKLPILFLTWKEMNERLFRDKYWACLLGTHDGFMVQLTSFVQERDVAEWVLKICMSISSKRGQIKMVGLMFKASERQRGLDAKQTYANFYGANPFIFLYASIEVHLSVSTLPSLLGPS